MRLNCFDKGVLNWKSWSLFSDTFTSCTRFGHSAFRQLLLCRNLELIIFLVTNWQASPCVHFFCDTIYYNSSSSFAIALNAPQLQLGSISLKRCVLGKKIIWRIIDAITTIWCQNICWEICPGIFCSSFPRSFVKPARQGQGSEHVHAPDGDYCWVRWRLLLS